MAGCKRCGEQVVPNYDQGWEVRCPGCGWSIPCDSIKEAEDKADDMNEGWERAKPIVWKQLDNKS